LIDRYTVIHSADNEIDTELKTNAELVLKLKLRTDFGCALIYPREVPDASQSGAIWRLRGTNHTFSEIRYRVSHLWREDSR